VRNIVNKTKSLRNRFKSLFKGIPIPTYLWQRILDELILIDYNDATDKITKGMIKKYIGRKASEMYENQPKILEALKCCANEHISIFKEIKYDYMSTGEVKFLSVKYGFIPPDLVIVHTEDISEKKILEKLKRSEKELKAVNLKLKQKISISEVKYRIIFENTGTATVIIEEDTTISLVNDQFEELSGYSREEIEWKKVWTEFVVQEDLERMKKFHYSRRKDPKSTLNKCEFRFINKEGNIRDIFIIIDMIPGTKNSVASLLDITERKQTESELQLERDNFLNILNSMEDGVYIVNKNYDIEYINPSFTKEFGSSKGIKCFNYFEDRNEICSRCKNKEVFQGKTVREEWYSPKNQKTYDIIDTPLKNLDGSISKLGIFRDISEFKRIEQELKESEEKYREAYNRAEFYKDIFAHDINNILQSILSGIQISQLILDNPEKIDNLKINAQIIKEQVIRGARLVSNVRKLSQLEEPKQNLKKIEIHKVLKEVISIVKKSYKDKNLDIRIDSVDENLLVKANDFLEDVFENLLINAIQHSRKNIMEITVRISKEQQNSIKYFKMEFLDNGIGIADSMKESIFKRAYSKKELFLGIGLGLSLVRGITEIYNGKIWVEDRVKGDRSKGSNFVLLIPEVD